jgi:hypothetical protein
LDNATKIINFIKHQFTPDCLKKLCENLDIQPISLLLHTDIWWLSRQRVLSRLFKLKGKFQDYSQENSKPEFAKCFDDEEWLEKLAYSADNFYYMNQLNKSLQGFKENVLTSSDKIIGFKRKLDLWKNHVVKVNLEMFPSD